MNLIKLKGYTAPFDSSTIIYAKAAGNYSILYLRGGKQIVVSLTLKAIHQLVPELVRIHRSYLVSPGSLGAYQADKKSDKAYVQVLDGPLLPVSMTYQRFFVPVGLNPKPVINLTTGTYYPSVSLAARAIGSHATLVSATLRGRLKSTRSNMFRLATSEEQAAQQPLHL